MVVETVWFAGVAFLFTGFFVLEGFDYGVGVLVPFLGRDEDERGQIIETIGPFWDANEVWVVAAGATMFAIFPAWYATLLRTFYLPFLVLIACLAMRGASFELRGEGEGPRWTRGWDAILAVTSGAAAFLWGLVMANLLRGLPITETGTLVGGVASLVNPYAVLGGLTALGLFTLHGANLLQLRLTGGLKDRAGRAARVAGAIATLLGFLFVVATYLFTPFVERLGVNPGILPVAAGASLVSVRFLLDRDRPGWAFGMGALTIAMASGTVFSGIYPHVIPSILGPQAGLTIQDAIAGETTLLWGAIVAGVLMPGVIVAQAYTYWIFRHRVTGEEEGY